MERRLEHLNYKPHEFQKHWHYYYYYYYYYPAKDRAKAPEYHPS